MSEDLGYTGPDITWKAPPGGNAQDLRVTTPVIDGYHDLPGLKDLLKQLLEELNSLISSGESDLGKFSLKIVPGSTLEQAQRAEWPSELGAPKDYISYDQYKSLENKGTRSATYIRQAYEDNARAESGTNALDVVNLANSIKSEATNIQGFLNDNIGQTVNDSAEKRTIELLQDWTENAIFHTGNIRSIFQEGKSPTTIPDAELGAVTPERASQYQAFFKVRINSLNTQIAQLQSEVKKDNDTFSSVYFNQYLGPALKFRTSATNGLEDEVGVGGVLGPEAATARDSTNANFSVILSDQMRRNSAFDQKQLLIQNALQERNKYASYINQLSTKGTSAPAPFVDVEISAEEQQHFATTSQDLTTQTTDRFTSPHADLAGTKDDTAHPQYLLKAGDSISGDIAVEDGVKVGGIVLNQHRHTGSDGSAKIHGSDIVGGTLSDGAVDQTVKPATPTELTLVSQRTAQTAPGGVTVEATFSWQGDSSSTYEVQISRL